MRAFPAMFFGMLCSVPFPAVGKASSYTRASLFDSPPFGRGRAAASSGTASGELELRGFFGPADDCEISVARSGIRDARWIHVGDGDGDLYVESADADAGTALVIDRGVWRTLRLKKAAPDGTIRPDDEENAQGPGNESDRLPSRKGVVFRRMIGEGMERLRREHPEYLRTNLDPATRRMLNELRQAVYDAASAAADAVED